MVGSLRKRTLRQEAYDLLLQAILNGEYSSGSRLDENQLATKLGISRTPVREALNRLIQEGIVVEAPYKGLYIRTFSQSEINNIYEVRKSLEVLAIQLAVRNMSENENADIEDVINKIEEAQNKDDIVAYSHWDAEFHEKIASFSKNKTLIKMLNIIDLQVKMMRQMVNQDINVVKRAQFERVKILTALKNKDENSATIFMKEHIGNVQQDARRMLKKENIDGDL